MGLNQKGSSVPLIVFGIVLIIIAVAVGYSNVGVTREQINEGEGFNVIFSDYILRFIIAIILLIIGLPLLILGVKR